MAIFAIFIYGAVFFDALLASRSAERYTFIGIALRLPLHAAATLEAD